MMTTIDIFIIGGDSFMGYVIVGCVVFSTSLFSVISILEVLPWGPDAAEQLVQYINKLTFLDATENDSS